MILDQRWSSYLRSIYIIMMTSSNGNISLVLALCEGNSPVTCGLPSQRPVTRRFNVFFDLCLNKVWTNNLDTSGLRRHRAHLGVTVMIVQKKQQTHAISLIQNFGMVGLRCGNKHMCAYLADIPGDVTFAIHTEELATFTVTCAVFLQTKSITYIIWLLTIPPVYYMAFCRVTILFIELIPCDW